MTYTTSKEVDKIVGKHLEVINKIILENCSPKTIILFGSYGKGEGTIFNNKPFNDYDIYIVEDKKRNDEFYEELGKKASKEIGFGGEEFIETLNESYDRNKFFHVDIRGLQYKKLNKLKKGQRTFEIKYASKILYGEDVRSKINVEESDISLSEAWRHAFNKSCLLLLSMNKERLNNNFKNDERLIIAYYSIKTFLACCDILLILRNRFKPTYQERNKLFKELYSSEFPELVKKIDFATKLKLNFQISKIKDVVKFWKEARDTLYFAVYLLAKTLGIEEKDKIKLMQGIYKKLPFAYFDPYLPSHKLYPAQYLLNFKYFLRTKHFKTLTTWRDPGIRIFFPAFLLLYAIESEEEFKALSIEIRNYLSKLAKINGSTFEDYRKAALYSYGKYYTQKLI